MIRFKKLFRWTVRVGVVSFLILIVAACTYAVVSGPYYSEKFSPGPRQDEFVALAAQIAPEVQLEGHTCGFHSLSSVYRAYGIDPEKARLRFRLGVDRVAVPGATGTEGTLHPDLFRVANQDGFHVELLEPDRPLAYRALLAHVAYNAAMILVARGEGLHWIVVDHGEHMKVRVSDSLEPEPILIDVREFFERPILSIVLLAPRGDREPLSIPALHAAGLEEMTRVWDRMDNANE